MITKDNDTILELKVETLKCNYIDKDTNYNNNTITNNNGNGKCSCDLNNNNNFKNIKNEFFIDTYDNYMNKNNDTNNNNNNHDDNNNCVIHAYNGIKKKMSDDDDDTRPIIPYIPPDPNDVTDETRSSLLKRPKIINWWTWVAYSQGHVYNDLCASMWFTYLMPYLQKCVKLSPTNAGVLMLVGQIADALATPIIGIFSDKGSTAWYCQLGRRKTWHIIGTILVTLSFPFIFSPRLPMIPFETAREQVLYFCPFICIFQFGWAAAQIAHLSLAPDLTPNENERTSLLSVRYAFTVISNILVYIITFVAVGVSSSTKDKDSLGPKDSQKFQYISYIVVIIGFFSTFIFYFGVSEMRNRQMQLDARQSSSTQMYESKKRTVAQLMKLPSLYVVAVLYMTARLFFNILQMFIVFYVQDTLALSKVNIAIIPLMILLSGFVTSLIIKPLNVKLGRKISHVIGLVLGLIVSIIVHIGADELYKLYLIYGVAILFGISSTVIQVTSFGMAADFVGDDVSNGAFIYGILSFADKTSNGVVGFFIQKFNPEEGYYYRLALSYGCGVPCLIGLVALLVLPSFSSAQPRSPNEEPRPDENDAIVNQATDMTDEINSF